MPFNYTAIFIETRQHPAIYFVLKNALENLSEEWSITIYCGNLNHEYILNIVNNKLEKYKHRICPIRMSINTLSINEYSKLLCTNLDFYNTIQTEMFLIFQTDSMIFPRYKDQINEFLQYDYVGASWDKGCLGVATNASVGNGGLSLRRKSKMIEIMKAVPYDNDLPEDAYFCNNKIINLHVPSKQEAMRFSVESMFHPESFGCHKPWNRGFDDMLINTYPEIRELLELNGIYYNEIETLANEEPIEIPKTIYMTYKDNPPVRVFDRWIQLNPEYSIDFSLDKDCIDFLNSNFGKDISDLFKNIWGGMFKADLWRLCKLYIHGGVYADIDIVPFVPIHRFTDDSCTFTSCISAYENSIFQAFIKTTPKNPLVLACLISFLQNSAYAESGNKLPTFDMFNCIKHNISNTDILPEFKYRINKVKIHIRIGSSNSNIKYIYLYYFPSDIKYSIHLITNMYGDIFKFDIQNNILMIKRTDSAGGWAADHEIDICISSYQKIQLLPEKREGDLWTDFYVSSHGEKCFNSREVEYYTAMENNESYV